jgi:hypothetical protein
MAVEYDYDGILIHATFSNVLTPADLIEVMRFILDVERRLARAPNRLADLGPSTTLAIAFGDIANLALLRDTTPPANSIRTAVVFHSAVQQGYARMFQTVNDNPLVTVQLFTDTGAARAWLLEG